MGKDMNRVTLVGRLAADPTVKTTTSGQEMARLRIATNFSWKDKDDAWKKSTDFHTIVAWQHLAADAAQLRCGAGIFVEGKLRSRAYTDEAGAKKWVTEVVADVLYPLVPKMAEIAEAA